MAQAHFDFDMPALPAEATTFESLGFEIGWDHAHYRLTPPVEHLLADHPVRQGWQAGGAVFGQRTLRASPQVRRWLALRLHAWARGDSFEPVQVTPNFLAQIDAAVCPVTREAIEAGVVDRLNSDAAYAAGNLVTLGARAQQAKAQLGWRDALARADRLEQAGAAADDEGLDAAQWRRLAVLLSFATPLPHALAATLPLLVLPPNRLRVLNPVQALQTLLTLPFVGTPTGRRLADLAALLPDADLRQTLQIFLNTLLARRVAAGRPGDLAAQRRVMEDAWQHPLVQRRWQRLAARMNEAACQRFVEQALRRGLLGHELRSWAPLHATEGWALDTAGKTAAAARSASPAGAAAPLTLGVRQRHHVAVVPGSAESLFPQ